MNTIRDKKLFLLDMDGTIYLGERLFAGATEFLHRIRARGGRYLFLTNNSSKGTAAYVKKLRRMGIAAQETDFLTSAQVTARYLRETYRDALLYVLGTRSLKAAFRKAGLHITDSYDEAVACLVMGFDTELTFSKLEDAARLLRREIGYVATNPDLVCPTEYGYVPDCGAVSEMLYHATGRKPRFIGKPEPEMVFQAMEETGFSKAETLLIGDRLYTDIACGLRAGVDTALVLSGETTAEAAEAAAEKPTYIYPDIRAILEELV